MIGAQRLYANVKFTQKLSELHGEAFESFFHDVMCARYPDFLDVRTYGKLGDQGSDGLSLYANKLYACYAPYTFDAAGVRKKFRGDLESALTKRPGQFGAFVFVHNDVRGVHPEVATMLVEARTAHPALRFEQMGRRHLWGQLLPLPRETVEDILGCEIPIEELTYGVGPADLAPLLEHLKDRRRTADPLMSLAEVSEEKLDFNRILGEERDQLRTGMRYTPLIAEYYAGLYDPLEEDEVAAGFHQEYLVARERSSDPEEVLLDLQHYIHGNRLHSVRELSAGWVVLAYFFERCHVFENVPEGWSPNGLPSGTGCP
ncbi:MULTISPECIES: ABC-three component system protein [Streptomyces]|uniref:ABC-three component system protein n=1 Tax=Streptomyces lycopersici TaxID=2974589 RepID=UPI0021CFF3A1|nr:ABC-three component system protein [Streptomyces sp. NEAU-383]